MREMDPGPEEEDVMSSWDWLQAAWQAPRRGAGAKKIAVTLKGLVWGWVFYLVVGYAAHLIAGRSPAWVWAFYRLFPLPPGPILPDLVWNIGLVGGLLLLLIGATGAAKITCRELKGDDFYGATDAWRFALTHARSTIGIPFLLGLLLLLGVLPLLLLGWVARIPTVGPVLIGLSAPLGLAVALGVILVLLALLLSLLLAPAVTAATGEDAVEGAIQTFGLLFRVPWRTAAGTLVTIFATTLAVWVSASLLYSALVFFAGTAGRVMGPGFRDLAGAALHFLPLGCPFFDDPSRWLLALAPVTSAGLPIPGPFPAGVGSLFGAILGGLSLLLLTGIGTAYAVSSLSAGLSGLYLELRRAKDGEDLLSWPDEVDELEEDLYRQASSGREGATSP